MNGLENRIFMLGAKVYPETAEILRKMDIFLLPSIQETFGGVLLEAMATGLPVIATNVGGVSEIIKDGENGLIVPPEDIKRLCEAIEYLVLFREKWISFSRAGREFVEKNFDGEKCGDKLNYIFQRLIREKKWNHL